MLHPDAGETSHDPTSNEEAYCLYCDMTSSPMYSFGERPDPEEVPAVDDDDSWANMAQWHADDCEWIATRAHRVDW